MPDLQTPKQETQSSVQSAALPSSKKHWYIIGPLLLLLAVAAGVYVWITYINLNETEQLNYLSPKPVHQIKETGVNELKDWKTYTDESHGFDFQYPSGWSVKNSGPNALLITEDNDKGQLMQISVTDHNEAVTIDEWLKEHFKREMADVESNIVHITFPETGLQYSQLRGIPGHPVDNMASYIIHDKKIIEIIVSPVSNLERDYINLVGSFKFIEPTSQISTAGWKTYTNTEFGYTIKYPSNLFLEPAKDHTDQIEIKTSPIDQLVSGVAPEGVEGKDWTANGYFILIGASDYKKQFDFNIWFNEARPYSILDKVDRIHVDNNDAYEFTVKDEIGAGKPDTVIPYNNKLYFISYASNNNANDTMGEKIYHTIISSFKFIK